MARSGGQVAAVRRQARAAEQRAHTAAQAAHRTAMATSPDSDLEGDVAQCADEAQRAHRRCGEWVRKCDASVRVPSYADKLEKRDAARDGARYARLAEQAADAAEGFAQAARAAAKHAQAVV